MLASGETVCLVLTILLPWSAQLEGKISWREICFVKTTLIAVEFLLGLHHRFGHVLVAFTLRLGTLGMLPKVIGLRIQEGSLRVRLTRCSATGLTALDYSSNVSC